MRISGGREEIERENGSKRDVEGDVGDVGNGR